MKNNCHKLMPCVNKLKFTTLIISGRSNVMKQRQLTPLGKKIVKRLVDLNQTQVWLCEKVGVSKVYLNFILHGERSGKKYMAKIFEVLGLDEDEQQSA